MFPHTITVYHVTHTKTSDGYKRYIVSNCYVEMTKTQRQSSANNYSNAVFTAVLDVAPSRTLVNQFSQGDIVVNGVGKEITSKKQLNAFYTVTQIKETVVGSDVDNIYIEAV